MRKNFFFNIAPAHVLREQRKLLATVLGGILTYYLFLNNQHINKIRTGFSFESNSSFFFFFLGFFVPLLLQTVLVFPIFLCHMPNQINYSAGVTVFIVVPAAYFEKPVV